MIILINSSKTMCSVKGETTEPMYSEVTNKLVSKIRKMSVKQISKFMHCSEAIANRVRGYYQSYGLQKSPALLTFQGDIYKHINAKNYSKEDWNFAQEHVLIGSGLYGLLKPKDGISLYRLEMADVKKEWTLKIKEDVLNLASNEYSSVVKMNNVKSVVFLTNGKQITIYSKYARGCLMNWCVKHKNFEIEKFTELGYSFSKWEDYVAYFDRKKEKQP